MRLTQIYVQIESILLEKLLHAGRREGEKERRIAEY